MIDIKLLQKDFDYVVKALQKKGVDNALLNNLKDLALKTKMIVAIMGGGVGRGGGGGWKLGAVDNKKKKKEKKNMIKEKL